MKNSCAALILATLCYIPAAYGDPKVGFMTTDATLSVGTVPITVWYPTSNQVKGPGEYIVPEYELFDFPIGTPVELKMPAGAIRDAAIKGGTFPLILSNPGGDAGNHMRLQNYPNNELLAAQGYIVVEAGRLVIDSSVDTELLRGLIDHMLWEHALRDSIDDTKIGARGTSFGGGPVAALAGWVAGEAPDERVRGIILDESFPCEPEVFFDCNAVTIPVMMRDGSQLPVFSDMAPAFAALENSVPRFLVTLNNPAHLGFATGQCGLVEAFREASVAYQEDFGVAEVVDPRNLFYSDLNPPSAILIGDTAGFSASLFWNFNFFVPNLGSVGDFCQTDDGAPEPIPALAGVMDNQMMIDTKHALNLAFWETVFGDGRSNYRVEKAVGKLDSVIHFSEVTE